MTRRFALVTALAALVAALSLTTAASASASIVFNNPANTAVLNVAPNVTWEYNGTVTTDSTCTLEFNSSVVAGPGICPNAPFSATFDATDAANITWNLAMGTFFTTHGDGVYELTVAVDFTVGGPTTNTLTFSRDTLDPAVTINSVASPTNDNTPTFSFSQTEVNPDTFECVISAAGQNSNAVAGYAPCTSPFTPGAAVPDGQRALYIRSTDDAGNIGYAAQGFIVDTVAPIITVTSPQPNQVMQSSVPELSFGAVDPDPGTGVSSFSCRYDGDAFTACNDAAFVAKNLAHGAHSLTIQATDGAANVATSVIPFSVDTDLGADPPTPGRVTFKKKSGKRAGKSYKLSVTASFTVPDGADPAVACKGKVRLSVTGRLPGKKSKTFTKQPSLSASGRTCVTTATFTLPKAYKGKRLTTKLIFRGNTVFGGFQRNGSIKKA